MYRTLHFALFASGILVVFPFICPGKAAVRWIWKLKREYHRQENLTDMAIWDKLRSRGKTAMKEERFPCENHQS